MDATTLNTIVGIIGIIVGFIGIIVGIIGGKSLSTAIKIKNTVKADNGSTLYNNSPTIITNNGLSSLDTIELAKQTTIKEISKFVEPEDFVKLDITTYSMVPVLDKKPPFVYTLEFIARKGKQCTLKFEKEVHSSNVKCSITDLDGTDLNLYAFGGSLGLLSQRLYKNLNFINSGSKEVIFTANQIVAGRTGDGNIVLVSIEPGHPWYYLPVKVALYVPFEVTP